MSYVAGKVCSVSPTYFQSLDYTHQLAVTCPYSVVAVAAEMEALCLHTHAVTAVQARSLQWLSPGVLRDGSLEDLVPVVSDVCCSDCDPGSWKDLCVIPCLQELA